MKIIDSTKRTTTLLTILSILYALFDTNIILLGPIVTIVIPYKFMKYKDENKVKENRKVLNNLFLFNIITFIGITLLTNKTGYIVTEIIVNITMTFVYFKILCSMEKKKEYIYENPEKAYEKINQKIEALEMLCEKVKYEVENSQNEKDRHSNQLKVDALNIKIEEAKQQLKLLEKQIQLKNSNSQQ